MCGSRRPRSRPGCDAAGRRATGSQSAGCCGWHLAIEPAAAKQTDLSTPSAPTDLRKSFDDIVDHCCYAWNTLIDQPWKIMSIAHRDWAVVGHSI
jgi:hypothetical protein